MHLHHPAGTLSDKWQFLSHWSWSLFSTMNSEAKSCSHPIRVPWICKHAIEHKIHVSHLHCCPATKQDRKAHLSYRQMGGWRLKRKHRPLHTVWGEGGEECQQTCWGRRLLGSSRRDWPGSELAASPPHPGHQTHSARRESEPQGEHHPLGWSLMSRIHSPLKS